MNNLTIGLMLLGISATIVLFPRLSGETFVVLLSLIWLAAYLLGEGMTYLWRKTRNARDLVSPARAFRSRKG